MPKFNVNLKVTNISHQVREIEADSLEDAEEMAEQEFAEEYDTGMGQLMITDVMDVTEVEGDEYE